MPRTDPRISIRPNQYHDNLHSPNLFVLSTVSVLSVLFDLSAMSGLSVLSVLSAMSALSVMFVLPVMSGQSVKLSPQFPKSTRSQLMGVPSLASRVIFLPRISS